ncbi:MAG: MerR family transcriptional regulator [Anaerovoracaceae bacterium]|nr:MerR family transcriptional regulator [Anaerovoracaceae bacterium]
MKDSEEKRYYSIGEVSSICKISKKALRFYDKIGIILPDKVSEETNYRFYSRRTLLMVPIIKYFKQMGFKLDEIKELFQDTSFMNYLNAFNKKLDELDRSRREIDIAYRSVKDWRTLIMEAERVISTRADNVSVRFFAPMDVIYLDQGFKYDYMDSVINIEFTNYISDNNAAITGPVMIQYPSYKDKMEGRCSEARVVQECVKVPDSRLLTRIGGGMYVSCYHIGTQDSLSDTYRKMVDWADENGYELAAPCMERYVTDFWTCQNPGMFVTEVLIEADRRD